MAEDRDLLHQISEAVSSITGAKGVAHAEILKHTSAGGSLEGVQEVEPRRTLSTSARLM